MSPEKERLADELVKIQDEIKKINEDCANRTMHPKVYRHLQARKKSLGFEIQRIQLRMTDLKHERRELLCEAFMQTVIKMFDPQDVSEVWDRLYVDFPHLKDERKWLK